MGVPKLVQWLIKYYTRTRQFEVQKGPTYASSLAIDANTLIHKALQIKYGYGEYKDDYVAQLARVDERAEENLRAIYKQELINILALARPHHLLVYAVDGVAPQAKIIQQRQRRYKSGTEKERPKFDSNQVSPGTDFMFAMQKYDEYLLFKDEDVRQYLEGVHVYYSSHLDPGEGEHKIMDLYRSGLPRSFELEHPMADGKQITWSHLLYGQDADLVLLALVSPLSNIICFREDLYRRLGEKDDPVPGTRPGSITTALQFFDVEILKGSVQTTFPTVPANEAYHNFLVLLSLLGNDFVPGIPSIFVTQEYARGRSSIHIGSIDDLFIAVQASGLKSVVNYEEPQPSIELKEIHARLGASYVEAEGLWTVDWDRLRGVLGYFALNKEKQALEQRLPVWASPALHEAVEKELLDLQTFKAVWYTRALVPRSLLQTTLPGLTIEKPETLNFLNAAAQPKEAEKGTPRKEELLPDITANLFLTTERLEDMVRSYLDGIEWTLRYYTKGPKWINVDWYYPYYYAPLAAELANYSGPLSTAAFAHEEMVQFTPLHQLLAILPRSSVRALPVELRSFMQAGSPIRDMFPDSFLTEIENRHDHHLAICLLPFPSRVRIDRAIGELVKEINVKKPPKRYKRGMDLRRYALPAVKRKQIRGDFQDLDGLTLARELEENLPEEYRRERAPQPRKVKINVAKIGATNEIPQGTAGSKYLIATGQNVHKSLRETALQMQEPPTKEVVPTGGPTRKETPLPSLGLRSARGRGRGRGVFGASDRALAKGQFL